VYVSDDDKNSIQKFDSDGNFITSWGSEGTDDGQFWLPHDIAIDSSDNVYVVDSGNVHEKKEICAI
jgi:DNA-binding beta-propeller fold protein YncE